MDNYNIVFWRYIQDVQMHWSARSVISHKKHGENNLSPKTKSKDE